MFTCTAILVLSPFLSFLLLFMFLSSLLLSLPPFSLFLLPSLPLFFPPYFFSSASLSEALKVYFSIHASTLMKDSNILAAHPHSSFLTNKTSKILFYKGKFPLQRNHQLLSEPLPGSKGSQSLHPPQVLGLAPQNKGGLLETANA